MYIQPLRPAAQNLAGGRAYHGAMRRYPDWAGLLRETVLAIDGEAVKGLYSVHWRDAGAELTADFRDSIEREPKRWKRFLITTNAGLYGLTRRLSPPRRLLFASAFLLALWGTFHVLSSGDWPDRAVASVIVLALAFALLLALIGMELVDKLRFRDELVMARELQAEIVPNVLPQIGGYELRRLQPGRQYRGRRHLRVCTPGGRPARNSLRRTPPATGWQPAW